MLDSILSQKTSFGYELIINDDASTDGTDEILLQYRERWPDRIGVILQSSNQFSKGLWPLEPCIRNSQGAYLAFCEGDDFWLSDDKLEKQVAAMTRSNVDISFHAAFRGIAAKPETQSLICDYASRPSIIPVETVIENDGGFMPSSSLMFRREVLDGLPRWLFRETPALDYYLQVLGSMRGALFLPGLKSFYRSGVVGSHSANLADDNRQIEVTQRHLQALPRLRSLAGEKCLPSFRRRVFRLVLDMALKPELSEDQKNRLIVNAHDLGRFEMLLCLLVSKMPPNLNYQIRRVVFRLRKHRKKRQMNKALPQCDAPRI